MQGTPATITNLNTTAGLLAHLIEQYKVDHAELRRLGDKWLAGKLCKWRHKLEKQLRKVLKRIEALDGTPSYDVGKPAGQTDTINPAIIIKRDLDLLVILDNLAVEFRADAMEDRADYTPDVFEHVIHVVEHQRGHLERELNLTAILTVPGYIGARLEDGKPPK